MSASRKPSNPRSGRESKSKEAPFYRPLSGLSLPSNPKSADTSPKAPQPPVVSRADRTRPSAPSEPVDDATVFERFMSGVEPLDASRARRISKTQSEVQSGFAQRAQSFAAELERADREALHKLHALVNDGTRFEVVDDGRRIEGRRRGADGGMLRRMRDGDVSVDATLNLVGMRVQDARSALEAFVCDRRMKGDRVVLILLGQRWESSSQTTILRGEVAAWLGEGTASTHVTAFLTAPPLLGGEGALCVLLAQPSETHKGMG